MSAVRGDPTGGAADHLVHFYVDDAELTAAAGGWLAEAVRGGAAVVFATEARRAGFAAQLRAEGIDVVTAREDGRLLEHDAERTLARIVRDGAIDRDAFSDVIGSALDDAAAGGRPVRAYGEMVALLWGAGDVWAAVELERAWNELVADERCSVYCAYREADTGSHDHGAALHEVLELHSAVVPGLARASVSEFPGDPEASTEARAFITGVLRRCGIGGRLLADARLVVSELATNAILHARSSFRLAVELRSSGVRIEVRDGSRALPRLREPDPRRPSGRGLPIVAALGSAWGAEVLPDGKLVWVELQR